MDMCAPKHKDGASLFYARRLMTRPTPLAFPLQGDDQGCVRTRARGRRFAVLRPASDDAMVMELVIAPPCWLFTVNVRGLRQETCGAQNVDL